MLERTAQKSKTAFRLLRELLRDRVDLFKARAAIPHYFQIEGFLSVSEALALYRYANKLPPNAQITEIGAWQGKSTYCLARGLRNGKLSVIDPFDASGGGDIESEKLYRSMKHGRTESLLDVFKTNMEQGDVVSKIEVLKGYSHQFAGQLPMMDLLFIDADHSIEGCAFDIDNFASCVRPGGYLMLHDYSPERPEFGPTWVINNKVIPSKQFETLEVTHSLWVGKRI